MWESCKMLQHVTIGMLQIGRSQILGNNVNIGANEIIIGDIFIIDNLRIGASANVLKDFSANTTVVDIWKQ